MLVRQPASCAIVFLVIISLLTGCMPVSEKDAEFQSFVAADDVNGAIRLDSAVVETSQMAGILITARISNRSRSWAIFPPEFGAVGYVWNPDAQEWRAIPNQVRLPDMPYLLGPIGGADASSSTVFYSPGVTWSGLGPIRLLVQGSLRNEDESLGEAVAAFIDVPPPE